MNDGRPRDGELPPEAKILEAKTAAYAALVAEDEFRRSERARLSLDRALGAAHQYVDALMPTFVGLRDRLRQMESSKFWAFRNGWFALKHRLGLSRVGPLAPLIVGDHHPDYSRAEDAYVQWLRNNALREADAARLCAVTPLLPYKPLISIIMPTYNTPLIYLRAAIDSVRHQVYPHWELCVGDDASTDEATLAALHEYEALDERVRIVFRSQNGHISRASNSALAIARGEFVALLDHDDVLTPEALYEFAVLLNHRPETDMAYSDEDKIDDTGRRYDPFFKPDWSPETMLSKMYSCHLGVYRRSLVEEIGGFRSEYDGSQDWDLVLRLTERTDRIAHIPKVLYSWRIHEGSAAKGPQAKPYAYDAARRALADALTRRGEEGTVAPVPDWPAGVFNVRYALRGRPAVDIVIPTRDGSAVLSGCLQSLFEKSTYARFAVTVVDNGSVETATHELFDDWRRREPQRFRVVRYDVPFNYSAINNYGVRQCDGDVVLFLNDDTEVIAPGWIEAMLEQAQRPPIGAVGAKLLYGDDTIQHAGVVLGIGGLAGHSHRHFPRDSGGHFNVLITATNYAAVTGACMMLRRSVFDEVGGFDENLAVAYNDVDLCLRLLEAGYRNVYVPHAELYHFESKTRGYDDNPVKHERTKSERRTMLRRWAPLIADDPYYNPHYTRVYENFELRGRD